MEDDELAQVCRLASGHVPCTNTRRSEPRVSHNSSNKAQDKVVEVVEMTRKTNENNKMSNVPQY